MQTDALAFLTDLLETPSPSGFEQLVQRRWLDRLDGVADRTWHDAYGNCFAALDPPGVEDPQTVALCGHADEIGLMVNYIDDDGFVYCRKIGGIDATQLVGKRVVFRSSVDGVDEPVHGVIGATAIHLRDGDARTKMRELHELFIDIGAADRKGAASRLNIGDPGVFAEGVLHLTDELIVARGLDNRIGIWAAAEGLRRCAERREDLAVRVVAVSTVQEEVGLHGASMIAESLRPNIALVTDVGHATDSPGISKAKHGDFKLRGGPQVSLGGAVQPAVAKRLMTIADRLEIPYQREASPASSGTDTDAIFLRNGGIPCGLLSLPIRYMHTTVELMNTEDLDRIAELFAAFCVDLDAAERFVSGIG